jgi:predicted membrane protein DUF2232
VGSSSSSADTVVVDSQRTRWLAPILLALIASLFSQGQIGLLLIVPLALLIVAMPPRQPALMAFGTLLLMVALLRPAGDSLWWLGRGWALVLGAWFIGVLAVRPAGGFIDRGLAAVLGAAASAGLLVLTNRAGWLQIDRTVAQSLRDDAAASLSTYWPRIGDDLLESRLRRLVTATVDLYTFVYPAFLAMASLCALAVAWWLWRRLIVKDAQPLARLRDFRFRLAWLWPFLVSVALILLPMSGGVTRVSANLATLLGALYVLRGFAIVNGYFADAGRRAGLLAGTFWLSSLLLFPLVAVSMLAVGLGDAWVGLRARPGVVNSSE